MDPYRSPFAFPVGRFNQNPRSRTRPRRGIEDAHLIIRQLNLFELRIKLANLASYILPGQIGLIGFYDIGKVWQEGYNDKRWHQGAGGGLYFAPAQIFVFQAVLGSSVEGLYPYFSAGFRF